MGLDTISSNANPISLFPSVLPWTRPPQLGKSRKSRRGRQEAFEWLQRLWRLLNFYEGGGPASKKAMTALTARARLCGWTAYHEERALQLFNELLVHCRNPRGTMGERGAGKLSKLISKIRLSHYNSEFTECTAEALPVDPNRISLPEQAGVIDPLKHLTGSRLQQFCDMPSAVPKTCPPGQVPKACHMVESARWPLLLEKLWKVGMICFVPVEKVPKTSKNKLLVGGLFCVPHKPESDRLINDRRPLNSHEERLFWADLPSGSQLCQLELGPGESIRASGDDLSNFFYLIRHLDTWLPRNCFGTPIKGSLLPDAGLDPNQSFMPAFRVVCMGDTNGVDIAQGVHEAILKEADCMNPSNVLVYRKVLPPSKTLEGLYIDDHIVMQLVSKKETRDRTPLPDEGLMHRSREHYARLNLPRSAKKAFDKAYSFTAWGTHVDSETGRVGIPHLKARQLEELLTHIVRARFCSKKALQKLLGLYVHPFMHCRLAMSVFDRVYLFVEHMPEQGLVKIPHHICDELLQAAVVLPVATSNIRRPIIARISATDASSKRGGRAATVTDRTFARVVARHAETRGEYVRLDWLDRPLQPDSDMDPLPAVLVESLQKHRWTETQTLPFKTKEHINLLELEMVHQELKDIIRQGKQELRQVNLCDSRVVVGAYAKGRSSARAINRRLRSCLALSLGGGIHLINVWVPTDKNPADYPSRNRKIPHPTPGVPDPLLTLQELKQVQQPLTPFLTWILADGNLSWNFSRLDEHSQNFSHSGCQKASSQTGQGLSTKAEQVFQEKAADPNLHGCRHRLVFKEVFARRGNLSKACLRVYGCKVDIPTDCCKRRQYLEHSKLLNPVAFDQLKQEAEQPSRLWHFGGLYRSFSILHRCNKGTRTDMNPWGSHSLESELVDNLLLRRTLHLLHIIEQAGSFWTFENPKNSYLWKIPEVVALLNRDSTHVAYLDQCAYGLKVPNTEGKSGFCKKQTVFAGNFPMIASLGRECPGNHNHVHAVGGVRTKTGWRQRSELAGHYPAQLCDAYAVAVSRLVT